MMKEAKEIKDEKVSKDAVTIEQMQASFVTAISKSDDDNQFSSKQDKY
jgi:hypothetical protein